jgi:hypothetical protein
MMIARFLGLAATMLALTVNGCAAEGSSTSGGSEADRGLEGGELASRTEDPSAESRQEPTRRDSAGVVLLSPGALPELGEERLRWELDPLREVSTIQDPGVPPLVFEPQSGARMPDGRLLVLDRGDVRLVLIDSIEPRADRRFARIGRGPGEMSGVSIAPLLVLQSGAIVTYDAGNGRLARFGSNGEAEGEVPLVPNGFSVIAEWGLDTEEGRMYLRTLHFAEGIPMADSIAHVDLSNGTLDPFVALPDRVEYSGVRQPLFHPRSVWTALPGGRIVTGRTDQGRLTVYDNDGGLEAILDLPLEPRAVRRDDHPEIASRLSNATTAGRPIEELPPIHSHFQLTTALHAVDDSTFALQHSRLAGAEGERWLGEREVVWRLFSTSGRYRGSLRLPDGFTAWGVTDGVLVGASLDSLGIATLQEFKLRPPPGL